MELQTGWPSFAAYSHLPGFIANHLQYLARWVIVASLGIYFLRAAQNLYRLRLLRR